MKSHLVNLVRLSFLAVMVFWALIPSAAAQDIPEIKAVRLGIHESATRVVIDVTAPIEFNARSKANPYQVIIDLPEVKAALPAGKGLAGKGVVSSYRYGSFAKNQYRLVLDLKQPIKIAEAKRLPPAEPGKPHRLMFDLMPVAAKAFQEQSFGKLAVKKLADPIVAPDVKKDSKRIVVIDAGHGGIDPGAIGRKGTYEKHITLLSARELRDQLLKTGKYEVVLTRDKDVFIPLRERVRLAREAKADLFISLHADSHPNRAVRGASVYMLSEKASDDEAAKLAERENKADLIAGIDLNDAPADVSNILIDLAQQETRGKSNVYGNLLADEFEEMGDALESPLRAAGFAVLKAPDVPSVLVEMGFLSHPKDEELLNKPHYRARVASAIVESINRFFEKIDTLPRT